MKRIVDLCSIGNAVIWILLGLTIYHQELQAQLFYTAEKINTDSLTRVLPGSSGENRIRTLNKLASAYFYTDPEKSLKLALEANSLLPEPASPTLLFDTRMSLGTAHMSLGDYPQAISSLLDAFETAKKAERFDLEFAAGKLIILTFLYTRNFDIAERMLTEFMQFDRSKVPGSLLFEIMVSAAWAHWSFLGNYEEALRLQHICLKVSDSVPVRKPNLALCLYQIGICQFYLDRFDSADQYFMKAEALCEKHQITKLQQYRSYWVDILAKLGRYDEALKMIEELTLFNELMQYYSQLADSFQTWGELLAVMNLPGEAIEKFDKALEHGEWVKTNKALSPDSAHNVDHWYSPGQNVKGYIMESGIRKVRDAHFWLYKQYSRLNLTDKALYHFVEYEKEKNALIQLERSKMVMEMDTKYQTEKKEKQIQALAQQNQTREAQLRMREFLLIAISTLSVVILILALVLIRQNRLRALHNALILEQKLLRSQMSPHFIFNTLASIQTFILQEDPEKASRYLTKFSKLVRNILDNSVEESVTLEREISTIENYLELQMIRYAGKFSYSLEIDENIATGDIYIPPMLCQPFIENALEHGLRHRDTPGRIDIHMFLHDHDLVIEISDDGVGRERARELESVQQFNHQPMATSITADRLKALNKRTKKKIRFVISDLTDVTGNAMGTRVKFIFPV